jgi:oligopeptide transport system permease protein
VLRYAAGRVLQMVLTLLVVLTLLWVAISVLPGDPVRALFGFRSPSPEAYARVQEQLRLDRPLLEQYLLYLRDVVTLDLGRTFPRDPFGRPEPGAEVWTLIKAAAPTSAVVLAGALVVQAVVGAVAGAVSAARSGTALGRSVDALALLARSSRWRPSSPPTWGSWSPGSSSWSASACPASAGCCSPRSPPATAAWWSGSSPSSRSS